MSPARTALKIGISEAVNTVLAIWMAEAAGLYAVDGLDIDIVDRKSVV